MNKKQSPSGLVAIAWAGKQTGDRELVRTAKCLLRSQFGVSLKFLKPGNLAESNRTAKSKEQVR